MKIFSFRQELNAISLMLVYLILVPNLFFWYLMFSYGIQRSIIDIDYFFVLLIPLFKELKIKKIMFTVVLFSVFFIDVFLILIQVFTLDYPTDLYYLLVQAEVVPIQFIFLFFLIILYFIVLVVVLFKLSKGLHSRKKFVSIVVVIIYLLVFFCGFFQKDKMLEKKYLFSSQVVNFIDYLRLKEAEAGRVSEFYYYPFHSPNYTTLTNQIKNHTQSNKILFILAESWGYSLNQKMNEDILRYIQNNKKSYQFFKLGKFNFNGFTLQGEQRELCSNKVTGLSKIVPASGYEQCIPNILVQHGYETVSLHGSSSTLYARDIWYLRAGLKHQYFKKDFQNYSVCKTFQGRCDADLMNFIPAKMLEHEKVFFYWVTLNTHFPYEDYPLNSRIQCENYQEPYDSQICRYIQSQALFFDSLVEILKKPEMRGVEVFIIGDHPPRFGDLNVKQKYFLDQVSWIHLKNK